MLLLMAQHLDTFQIETFNITESNINRRDASEDAIRLQHFATKILLSNGSSLAKRTAEMLL